MRRERVQLGRLFRVKHGYAFKSESFDASGPYALLTPGNFNEEGGFRDRGEKQKYYTGDVPEGFVLKEGDLIVAMTEQAEGLLGSSAIIPASDYYLHNQRLGRVVDLEEAKLDRKYLYYLFNTRSVRHQISAGATGTKVRHTAPERIGRVEVELPPLPVQRQIADNLSAYDGLIENNRRRMALLEEAARLLYREWFVRLGFPGHEHTRITNGVPTGWKRATLAEACASDGGIQTGPFGSQLHQADYSTAGIPVVMPKDIADYRVSLDSIARIPEELAQKLIRHRMQEGDVVYGRRGDIGRRALISRRQAGWLCGTGCLRLRPNQEIVMPQYFFDALGTPETVGTIVARAKGATMPNLNASIMESVPLLVASRLLQQQYVDQVAPMVELISVLAEQNIRLQAARDLLLPRLMSGEIAL